MKNFNLNFGLPQGVKRFSITIYLIAISTLIFSQKDVFESKTAFYDRINELSSQNDFSTALNLIDSVRKKNSFFASDEAYYLKGFIYHLKYKMNKNFQDYDSCLHYLTKSEFVGKEFSKNGDVIIKYLSNVNYNLAGRAIEAKDIDSAEFFYAAFKKAIIILDSSKYTSNDIKFNLACGSMCQSLYEKDRKINKLYADKALEYHKKVLLLDSNNYSAAYNTMILYYNDAVTNIKNAEYCKQVETANTVVWNDPTKPVPSIERLLECVKPEEFEKYNFTPLLRKALPYALKAHQLNPTDKNVLAALIGITYGTRDKKKNTQYKKELQKLG